MKLFYLVILFSALIFPASLLSAGEKGGPVPAPELTEDPPPPPPMMRKSPHDFFMEKLTPQEREEITKLIREKKTDELRARMRTLFLKYRPQEDKNVSDLSEKYLAAKTDEDKARLKKELEQAIRIQFAKRMEFTQRSIREAEENLKLAEKRLNALKQHYEKNQKNAEALIQMRLKRMCSPKSERKRFRPAPPKGQDKTNAFPGFRKQAD